jgi:heme-degrading monooxygenase HmoA
MFSVLFEVCPKSDQWEAYLDYAKILRPELEIIDGFVDNVRYRSLTRKGWILSLSSWRDEKSLVRWRTKMQHHAVQDRARSHVLMDYHLRVGEVTHDSRIPEGHTLQEHRLDETEVGEGTAVTLIDAKQPLDRTEINSIDNIAEWLGIAPFKGFLSWDVCDAILTPGDLILLINWRDAVPAKKFENSVKLPEFVRRRRVRIVRDYGMYDRREAPQYYPDAPSRKTVHCERVHGQAKDSRTK